MTKRPLDEYLDWLRLLFRNQKDFEIVGEASNGAEAIRMIETLTPDAVIADIDMPCFDGFEVARYVRGDWPNIKVILISSHTQRSYQKLARQEGAAAFIPKRKLSVDHLRHVLLEE